MAALDQIQEDLHTIKLALERKECEHDSLQIEIHYDGFVNTATCGVCGKDMCVRRDLNGFSRRFSAKRIYKMFIK